MPNNSIYQLAADEVRVLKNVCGMWLLEECRRAWALDDGTEPDISALLSGVETAPRFAAVVDVDAPDLAVPGQSAQTTARHLVGSRDGSRGAVVRTILESLVVRIAMRTAQIERLLGSARSTLHVVGGASRMTLGMPEIRSYEPDGSRDAWLAFGSRLLETS